MKNEITKYIINKTFDFIPIQYEMEAYAAEHHVPIISRDSLDLVVSLLKIKRPKKILEFGTAIGYSAILMASNVETDARIFSFERNEKRYETAVKNIKKAGLENSIFVYNEDATKSSKTLEDKEFDFVFIDAAKGQYKAFFDLVFDKVTPGGVIVSDNIFHKGLVCLQDINSVEKRQRTIYRRMNEYLDFLKSENDDFFTSLIPIGDGIAITYKSERKINE